MYDRCAFFKEYAFLISSLCLQTDIWRDTDNEIWRLEAKAWGLWRLASDCGRTITAMLLRIALPRHPRHFEVESENE